MARARSPQRHDCVCKGNDCSRDGNNLVWPGDAHRSADLSADVETFRTEVRISGLMSGFCAQK